MLRLTRIINQTLSFRISLTIVLFIATLLTTVLFVMFRFSRNAIKEEAMQNASMTLDATMQHIDNILLSVEQSAGNYYWDMLPYTSSPEKMIEYSRKFLEANPYITGTAIAFEPYYYKERGPHFLTYHRRLSVGSYASDKQDSIYTTTTADNSYLEHTWYKTAKEKGFPCWVNPQKKSLNKDEAAITFTIPMWSRSGHVVGVVAADVSLSLLTGIVQAAKPSPNSYAVMLDGNGSLIVHRDSNLLSRSVSTPFGDDIHGPSVQKVSQAMMNGEAGSQRLHLRGKDFRVFYRPFKPSVVPGRSIPDLGWSVGIVYPEEDIFKDYNQLLYIVIAIGVFSLLLLFILTTSFSHRLLLPLRMLTNSAQRIAEGHYNDFIPDSRQHDEVGQLQEHFQRMQRALSAHMGELRRLTDQLNAHGKELSRAYGQAKEADHLKTAFLHNMTNQMIPPVKSIETNVDQLNLYHHDDSTREYAAQLVDDIQQQGHVVTEILEKLLQLSLTDSKTAEPTKETEP